MAVTYDIRKEFLKDEVLQTLSEIAHPVEVAVWGSENSFNFGAIIRTCHNFLVRKMYAIDMDWYYKKAAMTALQWQKQNINMMSSEEFLRGTTNRNIIALERRENLDTQDIRCFEYPENPILLFGSEKTGVPEELLQSAKNIVSIPVCGFVLDYNIATACGIVLYDWYSKYTRNK